MPLSCSPLLPFGQLGPARSLSPWAVDFKEAWPLPASLPDSALPCFSPGSLAFGGGFSLALQR